MNSEKLLSQYLDTGVTIPPYQYNRMYAYPSAYIK